MRQGMQHPVLAINFEVLDRFKDTQDWLEHIARESDSHRNEFSFVPRGVYREFAGRDELYVLVVRGDSGARFAGHLMFNARHPRASILQMYVAPEFRRHGAATILLKHLVDQLTKHSFTLIYARVAQDLLAANDFWERQRFYVRRVEKGGRTTNRTILVRSRVLDTPQLFPSHDRDETNPLGLAATASDDLPLFLLDMNVLFDLKPRRVRRQDAVALIQAERLNLCRLAISDEIRKELKRSAQADRSTDPMEAVIDTFPCVPVHSQQGEDELIEKLAEIVFPDVPRGESLSPTQNSDLQHVAATIRNGLAGLITSDGAILAGARLIEEQYGVQIRSPGSFQIDQGLHDQSTFEPSENVALRMVQVSAEFEPSVRSMLSNKVGLSGSKIATNWLSIENSQRITAHYAVFCGSECLGYVTWANWAPDANIVLRAAIDESSPHAVEVARILLLYSIHRFCLGNPRKIGLDLPENQSILQDIAFGLGFARSREGVFVKSSLGRVVTQDSWASDRSALVDLEGPKLCDQPPAFTHFRQQVQLHAPDGELVHVALERLESLLSPVLFCLPGRPAVITPIWREFAESLLGTSPQQSLLPGGSASLFTERLYVSGKPHVQRFFRPGAIIFFYESARNRGRAQLVAVARVRESFLKNCEKLGVEDVRRSVLTTDQVKSTIGKSLMKTFVSFDNILPIPSPVGLECLRTLGCGQANQLLTTRPITDEQYQAIIREGFRYGR
jgi:ribosomal protein S18 acetylase RimI-like enzyme